MSESYSAEEIHERIESFLRPRSQSGLSAFADHPTGVRLTTSMHRGAWLVPRLLETPYAEHFRATFWGAIVLSRCLNGHGRLTLQERRYNKSRHEFVIPLNGSVPPLRVPIPVTGEPPAYMDIPEDRSYIFDGTRYARHHQIRRGDPAQDDKPSYEACFQMIRRQTPQLGVTPEYGPYWVAEEDYSSPWSYTLLGDRRRTPNNGE